jgi:hypothetical protein
MHLLFTFEMWFSMTVGLPMTWCLISRMMFWVFMYYVLVTSSALRDSGHLLHTYTHLWVISYNLVQLSPHIFLLITSSRLSLRIAILVPSCLLFNPIVSGCRAKPAPWRHDRSEVIEPSNTCGEPTEFGDNELGRDHVICKYDSIWQFLEGGHPKPKSFVGARGLVVFSCFSHFFQNGYG